MLSFTSEEIFASITHALLFGFIFAIIVSLLLMIKGVTEGLGQGIKEVIYFDRILPLPSFKYLKNQSKPGGVLSVFLIFTFAIGFSILSYVSLDGELRLYMLIVAFASFYLSKFAFFGFSSTIFVALFRLLFKLFSLVLRVIISVFKLTINPLKYVVKSALHFKIKK